jgi:uncharacterized protein
MNAKAPDTEALATISAKLDAIALALTRLAPPPMAQNRLDLAECFVWEPKTQHLQPVAEVNRLDLQLLRAISHVRDILFDNTMRFALGRPANNALLWGARGMGKSSLVKAVHAAVNAARGDMALKLVEIHREDIDSMPHLLRIVGASPFRFILYCDDLSFDTDDTSYKSLKAALEGGIEGRPHNVIFYATSNRRHLMPRDMIDNERSTAINPSEAIEEKVSLSDRFGLWLGFHKCSQEDYLEMVDAYAAHLNLPITADELHRQALEWATTRGSRSGRVAWQFTQDLAGRSEV